MTFNVEKFINSDFVNNLAAKEWYIKLSDLFEVLSRTELIIILIIALVLLSFMVYRKLGAGPMTVLVFVYLLVYILYQFNFLSVYEERELIKNQHMQLIQEELDK
ncbi:MAG: hypothetical protein U9Q85_02180 [Patescibacteria group bacterium]|nr:hypothetical protein [Patescibacteria group bacterium]